MTFVLGSSEAKDLAAAEGTNAQEDTPARRSEANDTVGGNTEGDDNKGNKEDNNPSLLSGKKGSRSICKKSPPKLTVRECYKLTNKEKRREVCDMSYLFFPISRWLLLMVYTE